MIHIINYGLGNLSSIKNIITKVGGISTIVNDVSQIKDASKIILPGVGAFDHGMRKLGEEGWISGLESAALERNIPILGICLGMQLMCNRSEEGKLSGLGWIDAEVCRFNMTPDAKLKVPHMGWNTVAIQKENLLLNKTQEEQRFYFVHSYHVVCNVQSDELATANYGYNFTAAFNKGNIFGVQFHPEKSHRFGMELLRKFIAL